MSKQGNKRLSWNEELTECLTKGRERTKGAFIEVLTHLTWQQTRIHKNLSSHTTSPKNKTPIPIEPNKKNYWVQKQHKCVKLKLLLLELNLNLAPQQKQTLIVKKHRHAWVRPRRGLLSACDSSGLLLSGIWLADWLMGSSNWSAVFVMTFYCFSTLTFLHITK